MNNKKIMEILENKGATLDKNYNNFNSDKGFMVSIKGQEVKVNKNDIEEIKKEIEKKREFIKNKKAIFYTATKVGKERNLELFSKQVVSVLDPAYEQVAFTSIEAVFDFISRKMPKEKLIIVIDELPY